MKQSNKSKNIKLYTFEQVFKKKTKRFKQGYEKESNRLELAKKIRELRHRRDLTQLAVARKAAMPQSVIARIESGEHSISVDTLSRVAHALGKRVVIA